MRDEGDVAMNHPECRNYAGFALPFGEYTSADRTSTGHQSVRPAERAFGPASAPSKCSDRTSTAEVLVYFEFTSALRTVQWQLCLI